MAILKKGQIGRTLMIGVTLVVVLTILVPAVSAYESHLLNVKIRVEERFNVIKIIRTATTAEIAEAIGDGIIPPDAGCVPAGDPPDEVPIETCVVWVVTIGIYNPHDYPMTEVVVTDHFGAELGGEPLPGLPVDVTVKTHSRGKSKKGSFQTQYRITWYVTYVTGDVSDPETVDNSGVMLPGDAEYIELLVWTKLNPSGRQEYTTAGTYTLNSGPTGKWYDAPPDLGGHQFSFEGDPVYIDAF
jgi:hypothetical protein